MSRQLLGYDFAHECCMCTGSSRCPLQHTATHCNTLQHTVTHCNTLQHTVTHCNTLQHTATHRNTLQHTATHRNTLQHTATHCNTLQHTATHCNTLQRCTCQGGGCGMRSRSWYVLDHRTCVWSYIKISHVICHIQQ